MMSHHTPGPWTATEAGPAEAVCWKVRDGNGRLVATGRSELRGDDTEASPLEPVAEANARLIAAAPALLAACEQAYRILGEVQGMVIINRDPGTQECLDQLEAAIALAKGGV